MGLVLELVIILTYVNAENKDNCIDERDPFYENLVKRMEFLEFRDRTRENENMELKQRVQALETLVTDQQSQISSLKETIEERDDVNKELYNRVQYLESREKANGAFQNETKSHNKRIQVIEQFITNLTLGRGNKDEERSVNRDIQRKKQSIEKRENEQNVAFFAYLNNHVENPGVHQVITFDHVTTNIGNGYNVFAGDFRAPVAGTYVFATTLMADTSRVPYHFQIMHNAKTVSSIYVENGGTGSQEVVLQLNQGDDVSIHNIDAGQKVYGHGYSTFSGFLLQQNYSSASIVGK